MCGVHACQHTSTLQHGAGTGGGVPDDKAGGVDAPEREGLDGLIVGWEKHSVQGGIELGVGVEVKPVGWGTDEGTHACTPKADAA
jgi:hypothetical protein